MCTCGRKSKGKGPPAPARRCSHLRFPVSLSFQPPAISPSWGGSRQINPHIRPGWASAQKKHCKYQWHTKKHCCNQSNWASWTGSKSTLRVSFLSYLSLSPCFPSPFIFFFLPQLSVWIKVALMSIMFNLIPVPNRNTCLPRPCCVWPILNPGWMRSTANTGLHCGRLKGV